MYVTVQRESVHLVQLSGVTSCANHSVTIQYPAAPLKRNDAVSIKRHRRISFKILLVKRRSTVVDALLRMVQEK